MLNSTVGHITGQFDVLKSFLQLDEKSERKEEKQVYIFLLQFFFKLSRMHEHNYIMIRLIIVTQDRGYINKKKKTCQKLFKQILGLSHQEYHRMVNLKQVCKPYGASIGDFLMFMCNVIKDYFRKESIIIIWINYQIIIKNKNSIHSHLSTMRCLWQRILILISSILRCYQVFQKKFYIGYQRNLQDIQWMNSKLLPKKKSTESVYI